MRTWREYQACTAKCDPQSLLGYGYPVHVACRAQCMYCGMGLDNKQTPEVKFDLWKQLSVEHIVPARWWPPHTTIIQEALRERLGCAEEDSRSLCERIKRMNTVSACHLCNSMTSRYPKRAEDGTIREFWAVILRRDLKVQDGTRGGVTILWQDTPPTKPLSQERGPCGGDTQGFMSSVASIIFKVWLEKSQLARQRLCGLRDYYSVCYAEKCGLAPHAASRDCDDPDHLDERVKAIIMGEQVYAVSKRNV